MRGLLVVVLAAGTLLAEDAERICREALEARGAERRELAEKIVALGAKGVEALKKAGDEATPLLKEVLKRHVEALDRGGDEREAARAALLAAPATAERLLKAAEDKGGEAERLYWLCRYRMSETLRRRTGLTMRDFPKWNWRRKVAAVVRLEKLGGEAAVETIKRVLEEEKQEAVLLAAANALVRVGDLEGLKFLRERGLERFASAPPDRYILLLGQGVKLMDTERYEEALAEFKKILEELPEDFEANYQAAMCHLFLKHHLSALKYFKKCLKLRPNDVIVHYNTACAYALLGDGDAAIEHLKKAVERGYDDAEHMAQDDDLASLREDARFKALLDKLRKHVEGEGR